jgi:hypothetical protein
MEKITHERIRGALAAAWSTQPTCWDRQADAVIILLAVPAGGERGNEARRMSDLVEFLRARLDARTQNADSIHSLGCAEIRIDGVCDCGEPERVRREVEAKRQITGILASAIQPGMTTYAGPAGVMLRQLAEPEADHPDYQQEWKP